MPHDIVSILEKHGIQPSAQRVAVAEYVLHTTEHPSADKVWAGVQESFPMISRATVYNTLNLFVEKGLLRELHLAPDSVLFDPNTDRHHHFTDEESGRVYDIPWNQVQQRDDASRLRCARLSGNHARSAARAPALTALRPARGGARQPATALRLSFSSNDCGRASPARPRFRPQRSSGRAAARLRSLTRRMDCEENVMRAIADEAWPEYRLLPNITKYANDHSHRTSGVPPSASTNVADPQRG